MRSEQRYMAPWVLMPVETFSPLARARLACPALRDCRGDHFRRYSEGSHRRGASLTAAWLSYLRLLGLRRRLVVAVFFQHASGLQHVLGFCSMSFLRLRALQCDLQHWGCTAPFAIAFKRKKAFNESSNHRSSRQGSFVIDQEHKFGDPRQSDTAHDNQTQSWTIKYNPSPHTVLFRSTLLTFTCSATCL